VVTNEPDARTEGPPGHKRGSGGRGWTLQNREASNLAAGRGSYSQHNTVVYKEGDQYRGMPHSNTILMNRADIDRAGFRAHQRVTVQGEAGALQNVEIVPGEIRSGAALMFYPEVNGHLQGGDRFPQRHPRLQTGTGAGAIGKGGGG